MFTAALLTVAKKVEATQGFIDRWMDKQNLLHSYNGTLLIKKEEDSDTFQCGWTLMTYSAKWNKQVTKWPIPYVRYHLDVRYLE